MKGGERFTTLLDHARADARVLGLSLSGSRGKGALVGPHSDYDVRLIVSGHEQDLERLLESRRGEAVEIVVWTLAEFEAYAAPGSSTAWDRYSFTHARVLLDRCDGPVQRLVDRKGTLGVEEALRTAREALDAYANSLLVRPFNWEPDVGYLRGLR